jgi:hypothetical protein
VAMVVIMMSLRCVGSTLGRIQVCMTIVCDPLRGPIAVG